MTTLTQLNEFDNYDPAHEADMRELRLEQLRADVGDEELDDDWGDHDYDDGGWTREDEESMNRGPDLPCRNEAGEYMF